MPTEYFSWWGKAGQGNDPATQHALPLHQLDVAAVADRLLDGIPRLTEHLSRLSGLPERPLRAWIRFWIAIHDLGKFSSAFQQLRPDLAPTRAPHYPYTIRHDTLGFLLWREALAPRLVERLATQLANPTDKDYLEPLLEYWAAAVMGHHGQPPKTEPHALRRHFSDRDIETALAYTDAIADQFLESDTGLDDLRELYVRAPTYSWWLAGLTVLADWVGSNDAWFPFQQAAESLEHYWESTALPAADHALAAAGLLPCGSGQRQPLGSLFDGIDDPTPLQSACMEMAWEPGPQLFLVEDITGAGKTEAAFLLLNRLLAAGDVHGAYLALPTMATANAMYRRTACVYRRLFSETDDPVSLVLAHGGRHLNDGFRDSLLPTIDKAGEYQRGEWDAGASCNAWFADSSKRSLLAQMGVGTIDQVVLAILQSRHQSLRLFGLFGKALIVDEVHASDAYLHRLLCTVLKFHARAGGSVILLSATLPEPMRDELVEAWCTGLERSPPRLEQNGYPLLTRVGEHDEAQQVVAARAESVRTLHFNLMHDPASVVEWVAQRAGEGACIAWVRNTVGDAIKAYEALAALIGPERITLFHARFAMGDRLAIEDRTLTAFGAESGPSSRRGRVVIATQVIEQSLDLDFDEMVSDLAPVDLLLQRAGRLRRHTRDCEGNRVDGLDQRGEPTLQVLSPDPDRETDGGWYRRLFPGAAFVYQDHGQLWRTARLIRDRNPIRLPEELRGWIDAVYGEQPAVALPEAMEASSLSADGQRSGDDSLATFNAIRMADGYSYTGSRWWDESYTPTRLGDPTRIIRLARWDGTRLHPWSDDAHHPWPLSQLQIRRALVEEAIVSEAIAAAVEQLQSAWSGGFRDALVLPFVADGDAWVAQARNGNGRPVTVTYDAVSGFQVGNIDPAGGVQGSVA